MRWPKFGCCVVRVNVRYLYPNQGEEGVSYSFPWLGGTPDFATFITVPEPPLRLRIDYRFSEGDDDVWDSLELRFFLAFQLDTQSLKLIHR